MIPYLIPLVVVIGGIIQYDFGGHKRYRKIVWYFLYVYLVLLIGLRYKVGIDTQNYMYAYKDIPDIFLVWEHFGDSVYQPFYLLLCSIAKTISLNFYVFQLLHALILNFCIFKFISKNTEYKFLALFVCFYMYFLYFNTEILKESLAVCIFMFSYENIQKKRWVRYYIGVLIACMFHISAVILIFYPLTNFLKLNWKYPIIVGIFIAILLGADSYLILFENFEKIGDKVDTYVEFNEAGAMNLNWIILNLMQLTIFPLSLLFFQKKIMKIETQYESLICMHALLGIGIIFYQIIFSRFTNYTMPFYALFVAQFFSLPLVRLSLKKFIVLSSFVLWMYLYAQYYLGGSSYFRMYQAWIPYSTIFNPIEVPVRGKIL